MALRDTIEQLQALERDAETARADRASVVAAWRDDIEHVYRAISVALTPYFVKNLAQFSRDDVTLTEEMLGTETYPRLNIDIVGRRVLVMPVARFTVGGTGRIDMYRANRPTEEDRALIVRGLKVPDVDPSTWWMEMKGSALVQPPGPSNGFARGSRRYRVMEQSSIEAALDYLLQLP